MEIITTHLHADFDCIASMVAAKKLYPEAVIVFPGSQEKNVRDYFAHAENPPHYRKLKGLNLDEITKVIVVDACSKGRIGIFAELAGRKGVEFYIFDHHPSSSADLPTDNAIIKERGASITILTEILREKNIAITKDDATLFALGLYEDTGSLTYPSVTKEDFLAASWLLENGADLSEVAHYVQKELDPLQIETLNDLLHNIDQRVVNGVTIAVSATSAPRFVGDIASIAQKVIDIEDIHVFFALVRVEERIHFVARSKVDAVSAREVAAVFGGGGHPAAASATIRDLTMPQAVEKVWSSMTTFIEPPPTAGDIMTGHVIVCEKSDTIKTAEQLMTRSDIGGLPVVTEGKAIGLITRQIVEKAIHHDLAERSVADFMTTEFISVTQETESSRLEEIILGRRQKLAPVNDPKTGKLVGLITRGMILQKLYGDSLKKPNGAPLAGGKRRAPLSRDMTGIFRERLPESIATLFHCIRDVADKNDFTAYVVGGFVRDLLMRIPNTDIDIVIEGDGIAFANMLALRLKGRVRSHKKFKTAVIILPDGAKIDVATARIEYYAHPAALPTVEMSAIRNDLYRRDFSINAMAIKLNGKRPNILIDFFGGQADIKDKAVRVLHNLSFVEDPTRAFRAIRFEARYGFRLGKQTTSLLKNAIKNELFHRLTSGRLFSELRQILEERRPAGAMRRLKEMGLLRFIHPALLFSESEELLMERLEDLLSWQDLASPKKKATAWLTRLMALFDRLDGAGLSSMIELFPTGGKALTELVKTRKLIHSLSRNKFLAGKLPDSELYQLFAPFSVEGLFYVAAKAGDKKTQMAVTHYLIELKDARPLISGDDLKTLGVLPSRKMGMALKQTMAAQLDHKVDNKKEALAFAKSFIDNNLD